MPEMPDPQPQREPSQPVRIVEQPDNYRRASEEAMARIHLTRQKKFLRTLVERHRADATMTVAQQLIMLTNSKHEKLLVDWQNMENPVRKLKGELLPSELVDDVVLDFIQMMEQIF